ncbi:MAG TPA: DUF748 domain-containing protein [Alphaproteobacteria bacterium]|nr:DUF748 domain-containing protein [Alphaproteobacteria bacterium]
MRNHSKAGENSSGHPARTNFFSRHRILFSIIGAIIILLIGVRLALPHVVRHYVNRQLQKSSTYAGSVGRVEISLYRGAYEIRDIHIFKRDGKIREPFFSAPYMDLSVQWPALFHRRVVARIYMQQPHVNFINGPTAAQKQTGENTSWDKMLQSLTPFKLNEVEIYDGEIHYKDDYSTPKVDLYISKLGASATNLSNAQHQPLQLPAGIRAHGKTIGDGTLDFHLQMNPMAPAPDYQLQVALTNVNLPALNSFLRAYGKFDVARGGFAMFTSVAATNSAYQGYIKVFFNNLDVFEWQKEKREHKSAVKIFWDAIVGAVSTVFRNLPKDQLAVKVPISGVYTNSSVDLTSTLGSLLRNAFIRALIPKYDQQITTAEVTRNVKAGLIPNANTNGVGTATRSTGLPKEPPAREKHGATLLQSTENTNKAAAPP